MNSPPMPGVPQRTLSTPPSFSDIVEARFLARTELYPTEQSAVLTSRYVELRDRFEALEGKIQREYWGSRLPIGLVLTERPRSRWRRALRRAPSRDRRTRYRLTVNPGIAVQIPRRS